MLTAEATGSRDSSVKENCGIKLLSRYGPKGWRMMAEDVPMPPPSDVTGRIQVVTAGKAREAQTPEMDPVLARKLVLAGAISPLPHDMPCQPRRPVTVTGAPVLNGASDLRAETVSVTPGPGPVSLSEAVRKGLLHPRTTLGSLRMARHRDGDFPQPVGQNGVAHLYDAADLAGWDAGRR